MRKTSLLFLAVAIIVATANICLGPGESTNITFTVGKDELSYYSPSGKQIFENGEFEIMAGASSADIRLKETVIL